jgi:hypothetical protein
MPSRLYLRDISVKKVWGWLLVGKSAENAPMMGRWPSRKECGGPG